MRTCAFFPGVDDTVSALLQYPGGVHGSFTCSISSNLPNTAYVTGTKGVAQVRHHVPGRGDPVQPPLEGMPGAELSFTMLLRRSHSLSAELGGGVGGVPEATVPCPQVLGQTSSSDVWVLGPGMEA